MIQFLFIAIVSLGTSGCVGSPVRTANVPGVNHFFKVDDNLYRGAQPTDEGIERLADMGVKTIVNLRAQSRTVRADQKALAETYGMNFVSLPMRMYFRPKVSQIQEFLNTLQESQGPVFIHCHQGEDRTGSMVAVYRIAQQGWQPDDAYEEAVELGMAPWNPFMKDLIMDEADPFSVDL